MAVQGVLVRLFFGAGGTRDSSVPVSGFTGIPEPKSDPREEEMVGGIEDISIAGRSPGVFLLREFGEVGCD